MINGVPIGNYTATRIMRGAGGFSVGINFANDGTAVEGGDVHGCYILSPTDLEWRPLLLTSIVPAASYQGSLVAVYDATGCYAIAIAPSNSAIVYFTFNGYLHSYNDTTKVAVQTALPQKHLSSNSGNVRHWGYKLVIDNQNPNVSLFGTQGQSVFATTNGWASYTDLSVAAGATDKTGSGLPNPHLVAFDPTGPITSGIRQRWYYTINNPCTVTGTVGGNPALTAGDQFSINGTTVTVPASPNNTAYGMIAVISGAGIAGIWATADPAGTGKLQIVNVITGGAVTLANVSGTSFAACGFTAGTTAANNGGIFESTAGPAGPYTLKTGSPADACYMNFDPSGRMWVCGVSGKVYNYTAGGSFAQNTGIPAGGWTSVVVDPATSGSTSHIVACDGGGNLAMSWDNGSHWSSFPGSGSGTIYQTSRATTQAYLDTTAAHNRGGSSGVIVFNPAKTSELWQSWGFAPRKCTPPANSSGQFNWVENGKGIDMACCTSLICPSGVGPVAGFFDLGTWKLSDFVNASNRPAGPVKVTDTWTDVPVVIVQPTNALEHAADNPQHVVSLTTNGWNPYPGGSQSNPHGGYSNDGWTSNFNLFGAQVPGEPAYSGSNYGGCMAVGPAGQAIVAWTAKQGIYWSTDGTYTTWNLLTSANFPGLPSPGTENGIGDWSNGFFSLKNICYDAIGRNWYAQAYSVGSVVGGIYKAPAPGGPWTQIYSGTLPFNVYHRRLRPTGRVAGELVFVSGVGQNTPMVKLVDNFDGTMTAANIANTAYCTDIAFGKAFNGGTSPVVMTFGFVNSQWGYHVSYDFMQTWQHLGYIDGWLDWPKVLVGDPDNFGVFYAGRSGSGVGRIVYVFPFSVH